MKSQITPKDLRLFDELRAGGINIDEALLKENKARLRGLTVYQTGNFIESAIYDADSGETCFVVSVAVTNRSDRNIGLRECRLEIPWEWNLRWLPNPATQIPRQYAYCHPAFGPAGFEPEVVLNHRFGPRRTLLPGDSIEGILIGAGESRVPEQYLHRQGIRMRLSVFDGRGNSSDLNVVLMVVRPESRQRRSNTGSDATKITASNHLVERTSAQQFRKTPAAVEVGSPAHSGMASHHVGKRA